MNYDWRDFAILVRANNHAEPFARALGRAGIPYQFLGPGRLFRQPEVKDLIAYLKVLYNFEDNVAMYRVLTMDWVGINARDVASLVTYSRKYGISLFESCEKSELENVKKLVVMIHKHLGLIKKETAGQILYYFLEETGLLKSLAAYKTVDEEKVAGNVSKFFNKLKTYEVDHEDASVFAVVDWIDLSMTLGESPIATDTDWGENNAVNIMTIHSAKGLEFPVVFLVNLVSQRFPTMERKDQIPIPDFLIKEILPKGDFHTEEERRLFYVGMTRARDFLFFTGAKFYGEGKREKKLSPFVEESIGEQKLLVVDNQVSDTSKQLSFLDWKKTDEKENLPVRQKISYLSYSQLSTFTTCPLQYKYRYMIKIPVPPSAALTFGDTIHKTVHAFYELVKSGDHPTKETLLRLLDDHWSSIGYGGKQYEDKMKVHGKELLIGFFDKGYDPNVVPTVLEEPFKIKITPALTLGGKIDRIDTLADGTIEIIDYKTGTAPKSRDVTRDPQLTVYALSASTGGMFHTPPKKVIVSFYFFEDQQKVTAVRTKEELEAAKKDIAEKAAAIERSDFAPTPGKHCDFCEFRLICEAWN
jgi:DNA helicase II / ATP-dependent DNA helicase PcrA